MTLETSADARRVADLLQNQFLEMHQYLDGLSPDDWRAQSFCTDWKAYQVISHLGSGAEIANGTIRHTLLDAPAMGDAERKAAWARFDALPPDRVRAAYSETHQRLFTTLDQLTGVQLAGQVPWFTGGTVPLARFLAARLNEQTIHRWDVEVVKNPQATLNPTTLPDLLGLNRDRAAALAKPDQAGALKGKTVEFDLSDPRATVRVPIGEGADEAQPALRVSTASETFIRLIWGRYRAPAAPARLELDHPDLKDDLIKAFPGR